MNDARLSAHGVALLHDPATNHGTAFTAAEREALGLRGLLPPRVFTIEQQAGRILENFARKPDDLEKYIFMTSLQERNETLFYRVLVDHLETMMPIVYTPTVGLACQAYGQIFRRPHGLYVSAADRGRIAEVVANWPADDIEVVVVTDGERILGLGDLGAHGMGIPVGKLSLYTACAGIHPARCLPVTIDVGTDNERLLADPLYIGLQQRRLRGEAYDALVDELMSALQRRSPRALIQFEDFANRNAHRLLEKYRKSVRCFNDDIQGTAAVTVAGLLSALRITGRPLRDQRVLFLGAGTAGMGIAGGIVLTMMDEGLDAAAAHGNCWLFDLGGLLVSSRPDLAAHQRLYAHEHAPVSDLLSAVEALRPTMLIGVSGQGGAFSESVVRAMASHHERPIIFALSNPTSSAECTAEQAYRWSGGRALFASGSPFAPVTIDGRTHVPGQGNNVYIFPGVGLGVIASRARLVTNEMFMAAAKTVASEVSARDLELGRIYPPLTAIREVSAAIATAVAEVAYAQGLAEEPRPADLRARVESLMYEPVYAGA